MKQHALGMALTLYHDGTLDLETAAARAGVAPESLRRALARTGRSVAEHETGAERRLERVGASAD